jgi:ribonuclease HI
MEIITYSDGGARGNPGPAAYGVVVEAVNGQQLATYGRYIGETTNNQAEYRGLISALETALKEGGTTIQCFLDSELIVKQMTGEYRVKDAGLKPLFVMAKDLAAQFKSISFTHIPRAKNKLADQMVNEALDAHT